MLGMHAATFGLYMISILVYYVFYVNFYLFEYDESSKIEYFSQLKKNAEFIFIVL